MKIMLIDRRTGAKIEEVIAGESFIKWSCQSILGKLFMDMIGSKKFLSLLMGHYQNSRYSKSQIHKFVKKMDINLEEAERSMISEYKTFNDFFTRKLKPGVRSINAADDVVISPADGRVLAYQNLREYQMLQVKGKYFSIKELLADPVSAEQFKNGSCIVVRLNPSDYHRFHFPISCIPKAHQVIAGQYYSVNPMSLECVDKVYCKNVRHISYLKNGKHGIIGVVEVGATMVGSVVQTYDPDCEAKKGEEKGYFQFGGSTVILLFQPNQITLDADLIVNTMNGFETLIRMGEAIGKIKDVG